MFHRSLKRHPCHKARKALKTTSIMKRTSSVSLMLLSVLAALPLKPLRDGPLLRPNLPLVMVLKVTAMALETVEPLILSLRLLPSPSRPLLLVAPQAPSQASTMALLHNSTVLAAWDAT